MSVYELLLVSAALSMDAFAAAVCKGMSIRKLRISHTVTVGLYFGFSQAVMPFIGYHIANRLSGTLSLYGHWIAFVLLGAIGADMITNTNKESCGESGNPVSFQKLAPLAIATSIDALAAGVSFAFLKVKVLPALCLIGAITFAVSSFGVKIGHTAGAKFHGKAEEIGGLTLILIGIKILFEHTGIL